jgi:hypothetical protein
MNVGIVSSALDTFARVIIAVPGDRAGGTSFFAKIAIRAGRVGQRLAVGGNRSVKRDDTEVDIRAEPGMQHDSIFSNDA